MVFYGLQWRLGVDENILSVGEQTKCSLMSVYWDRRCLRNVRKLSLLSFPKSTILSKTTKPTFPSRDEKIERIGYRCATEGIEKCYYAPVKNPL